MFSPYIKILFSIFNPVLQNTRYMELRYKQGYKVDTEDRKLNEVLKKQASNLHMVSVS